MTMVRGALTAVLVTAVLAVSACTSTGRFSATAICERSGGQLVGFTCEHQSTPAEMAAERWCETHGGVYLQDDGCEFGEGGP